MTRATTGQPTAAGSLQAWRRVGVGAAAVVAVWSIVLQLVVESVIPPVAIIGGVFAALAILLARSTRTWVHVVTALFPLLALGGSAQSIAVDLGYPAAAALFTLSTVAVVGMLVTAAAGFLLWWGRADRGAVPVAAASVGVVVLSATVGLVAATGIETAEPVAGDVLVETQPLDFAPDEIVVPTGSGVWIDNPGRGLHTFSVGGTDVDLDLLPGSSRRWEPTLGPGTYSVFCAIPGHESMTASLVIEG